MRILQNTYSIPLKSTKTSIQKHNLYFSLENGEYKNIKEILRLSYPTNFDDRKFREVAQQRLFKKVKTLQKPYTRYEEIKSDIFYLDFGVEHTYDDISQMVSSQIKDIVATQPDEVKSMRKSFVFCALHLNQSTPHLHRLFVLSNEYIANFRFLYQKSFLDTHKRIC